MVLPKSVRKSFSNVGFSTSCDHSFFWSLEELYLFSFKSPANEAIPWRPRAPAQSPIRQPSDLRFVVATENYIVLNIKTREAHAIWIYDITTNEQLMMPNIFPDCSCKTIAVQETPQYLIVIASHYSKDDGWVSVHRYELWSPRPWRVTSRVVSTEQSHIIKHLSINKQGDFLAAITVHSDLLSWNLGDVFAGALNAFTTSCGTYEKVTFSNSLPLQHQQALHSDHHRRTPARPRSMPAVFPQRPSSNPLTPSTTISSARQTPLKNNIVPAQNPALSMANGPSSYLHPPPLIPRPPAYRNKISPNSAHMAA